MNKKAIIFLIFTAIFSILTLGFDQIVYQIENQLVQKDDKINEIDLKILENRNEIEFAFRKTIMNDWNTLNFNDGITKSYFIENDLSMRFNSYSNRIETFINSELKELTDKIILEKQSTNYVELLRKILNEPNFNEFTIEDNTFEWSVTNSLNHLVNIKKLYLIILINRFEDEYNYFLKKDILMKEGNYETLRQIFVLGSFIATMLSIIFLLLYFRSLLKPTNIKITPSID